MKEHTFTVTVRGCTREQAQRVMDERILHDEDYGFYYGIDYESEWTYCECGNRLETPAEYEDGTCEWCYEDKLDQQEEEADDSLIDMSNYLVKSFPEGGYIRLDFGAPGPMVGTWVSSILVDSEGYMVGDGRTKEVCYNGYTNLELIDLELARHSR